MKINWRSMRNVFVVAGLGVSVGLVAPSCVVRAQVRPAYVVDEAPPAPRYQNPAPREGYVWAQGKWEWRANKWTWASGHWVRARAGQTWEPGRWEQRGSRWHFVEGRWVAGAGGNANVRDHRAQAPAPQPNVRDHRTPAPAPQPNVRDHRTSAPAPASTAYPTAAPPAPQYETPAARSGFVWVQGHYEWKNGAYSWTRGHWERARAAKVWVPGSWAAQGGRWVWTPGQWADAPAPAAGPKVRDKRTKAPEGRKNEVVPARRCGQ
jgi:hypothetical protein